jgi:hypothetical protein
MSKPRSCPHCKKSIPLDHEFSFTPELNLICGKCGKVVFEVVEPPSTTSYGYNASNNYGTYNGAGYPSGRQAVHHHE